MHTHTLAIIKPRAVQEGHSGPIITQIEQAGFRVVQLHKRLLHAEEAANLYQEHKEKPFYQEMCSYMTSSPVVLLVLEKADAAAAFQASGAGLFRSFPFSP